MKTLMILATMTYMAPVALAQPPAATPVADQGKGAIMLNIGGKATYFTAVSGLDNENEVTEHKVMGQNGRETIRKIPGRLKSGSFVLAMPAGPSALPMAQWRQQVVDGAADRARADCSVTFLSRTMTPVQQIDLLKCWPSRLTFSLSKEGVMEMSLTIANEGMKVTK